MSLKGEYYVSDRALSLKRMQQGKPIRSSSQKTSYSATSAASQTRPSSTLELQQRLLATTREKSVNNTRQRRCRSNDVPAHRAQSPKPAKSSHSDLHIIDETPCENETSLEESEQFSAVISHLDQPNIDLASDKQSESVPSYKQNIVLQNNFPFGVPEGPETFC